MLIILPGEARTMKYIQHNLMPTSTLEHLIPFLLMVFFVNGYLILISPSFWATLRSGGSDIFSASLSIIIGFITVNLFCLLGYALSRLCIIALSVAVRQFARH